MSCVFSGISFCVSSSSHSCSRTEASAPFPSSALSSFILFSPSVLFSSFYLFPPHAVNKTPQHRMIPRNALHVKFLIRCFRIFIFSSSLSAARPLSEMPILVTACFAKRSAGSCYKLPLIKNYHRARGKAIYKDTLTG